MDGIIAMWDINVHSTLFKFTRKLDRLRNVYGNGYGNGHGNGHGKELGNGHGRGDEHRQ